MPDGIAELRELLVGRRFRIGRIGEPGVIEKLNFVNRINTRGQARFSSLQVIQRQVPRSAKHERVRLTNRVFVLDLANPHVGFLDDVLNLLWRHDPYDQAGNTPAQGREDFEQCVGVLRTQGVHRSDFCRRSSMTIWLRFWTYCQVKNGCMRLGALALT